jgi:hypothetical protein
MNVRDEARAALDEYDRGPWWRTAATVEARAVEALRALLDEPVPTDEREALVKVLREVRFRPLTPHVHVLAADSILAAGFRRHGPITDAMAAAVGRVIYQFECAGSDTEPDWDAEDAGTHTYYTNAGRAALEGAEAAR